MEETVEPKVQLNAFNIVSMVLGTVSLMTTSAILWIIGIPFALVSLVFGILGVKKPGRGLALVGIVTSTIALILYISLTIVALAYGVVE